MEGKKIKREDVLAATLDLLCSSVGSLTNPNSIANSLNSRQKRAGENTIVANTVTVYIGHLADSYLFEKCRRYDVKGKDYFDYDDSGMLIIGILDFLLDDSLGKKRSPRGVLIMGD